MLTLGFSSGRSGTSALPIWDGTLPLAPVVLDYVSPSALETFAACPRKWAWVKLDRVPKTQGAGAVLGSAVHEQHERWLRDATPYDLTTRAGELALATFSWLPAPMTGNVEQEITFDYEGIRFGGKIDWNGVDQPPPHPASRAVVLDHKSTSDLAWAKLERAELLEHPQAPIYGKWATIEHQTEWVEFRWNYVETKRKTGTPRTERSWHLVHRDEIDQHMVEPVRVARELLHVVQVANHERAAGRPFGALDVPYNASHCGAFGGCQFRDRCNLNAQEQFASMTQQSQTIFERLRNKGAAQAAAQPAPAQAPAFTAPTQPANPAPAAVQAPWSPPAAVVRPLAPSDVLPGSPQTAHVVLPMQFSPAASAPVEGYGGQVNPPESAVAPVVPIKSEAQLAAEGFVKVTPAEIEARQPTPAAEPAPRGRGRPPKEKPTAATVSVELKDETGCRELVFVSNMLQSGAYTQWQPADVVAYARAVVAALAAQGAP